MTLWIFLLALGLTARLTRLLVDDTIAEPIRAAARRAAVKGREYDPESADFLTPSTRRNRAAKWVSTLIECPWCASVWIAWGVYGVAYLTSQSGGAFLTFFAWFAAAMTASYLVGIFTTWQYRYDG